MPINIGNPLNLFKPKKRPMRVGPMSTPVGGTPPAPVGTIAPTGGGGGQGYLFGGNTGITYDSLQRQREAASLRAQQPVQTEIPETVGEGVVLLGKGLLDAWSNTLLTEQEQAKAKADYEAVLTALDANPAFANHTPEQKAAIAQASVSGSPVGAALLEHAIARQDASDERTFDASQLAAKLKSDADALAAEGKHEMALETLRGANAVLEARTQGEAQAIVANIEARADIHAADQRLKGTIHTADRGLEGTNRTAEAHEYASDNRLLSVLHEVDLGHAGLSSEERIAKAKVLAERYGIDVEDERLRFVAGMDDETKRWMASLDSDTQRALGNLDADTARYVADSQATSAEEVQLLANEAAVLRARIEERWRVYGFDQGVMGKQIDANTLIEVKRMDQEFERMQAELAGQGDLDEISAKRLSAISANTLMGHKIDQIMQFVDDHARVTGIIGAGLGGLPGSDAFDLREMVKSLGSSIAFQALFDMRSHPDNKTGGALGQISNRELDLLKATLGALEPNMSRKGFIKSLKDIKRALYVNYLVQSHFADPAGVPEAHVAGELAKLGYRYDTTTDGFIQSLQPDELTGPVTSLDALRALSTSTPSPELDVNSALFGPR